MKMYYKLFLQCFLVWNRIINSKQSVELVRLTHDKIASQFPYLVKSKTFPFTTIIRFVIRNCTIKFPRPFSPNSRVPAFFLFEQMVSIL